MTTSNLTPERLRELLHYDPLTGEFIWKVGSSNRLICIGDIAGYENKRGYCYIGINHKSYLAYRLAWLYMTNAWPTDKIDHRDGNPANNSWANLRDVSNQTNIQNQRKAQKRNKAGFLGVCIMPNRKKKYVAFIDVEGKTKYLGYFYTPEEAHAAYLEAKRRFHSGCTI